MYLVPGTQLLTSAFVEISLPLPPLPLMVHHNTRDFLLCHFHHVRDGALRIILGNTEEESKGHIIVRGREGFLASTTYRHTGVVEW